MKCWCEDLSYTCIKCELEHSIDKLKAEDQILIEAANYLLGREMTDNQLREYRAIDQELEKRGIDLGDYL